MKKVSGMVLLLIVALIGIFPVRAQEATNSEPLPFGARHTITVGSVSMGESEILTCLYISGNSPISPTITKCFAIAKVSLSSVIQLPNGHVTITIFVEPKYAQPVICTYQTGEDDRAPISSDCQNVPSI